MKMTKEIEEYINLTITEHMGKSYTVWKLKQQTEVEPDEVEKIAESNAYNLFSKVDRNKVLAQILSVDMCLSAYKTGINCL